MHRLVAVTVLGCSSLALAAPAEKPKIVTLQPRDPAVPQTPEQAGTQRRAELNALYEGLSAAAERGDAKAFLTVRLPEYTEVAPDGRTLDAAGAARALTAWLDALRRPARIEYGLGKTDAQNDLLTVLVAKRVVHREVIEGKSVEVEVSSQRHETWLRRPEGWRLRHAGPESVVQRMVDGVVVPGS